MDANLSEATIPVVPADDSMLHDKALKLFNAGHTAEAEKILGFLCQNRPDDFKIMNDYGVCLFSNGKVREAIDRFIASLDRAPGFTEALCNLKTASAEFFRSVNDNGRIRGHLNSPTLEGTDAVKGMLCCEGWALAEEGVEKIDVYVDDTFICRADYGIPRPDVSLAYPDAENTAGSGFMFYLNTIPFDNGIYRLTIIIFSRTGEYWTIERFLRIRNERLTEREKHILDSCGVWAGHEYIWDRSVFLPSYFSLETTVACPSDCIMCPRSAVLGKRRSAFMPEYLVDKILDEIDWNCYINWQWINDPLCDDRVFGFMDKSKRKGLENWITTTGYLLNDKICRQILSGDVDVVCFSVDTLDREAYRKIRRGLDLDTVLRNIEAFLSLHEKLGSKTDVWVTKVRLPVTSGEDKEQYIDFFEKLGIKKVQFPAYRLRGGELDREIDQHVPDRKSCYFIENEMAITVDGDVVLCTCEAGASVQPEANISRITVKDAWMTRKRFETIKLIRSEGLRKYKECREHADWS